MTMDMNSAVNYAADSLASSVSSPDCANRRRRLTTGLITVVYTIYIPHSDPDNATRVALAEAFLNRVSNATSTPTIIDVFPSLATSNDPDVTGSTFVFVAGTSVVINDEILTRAVYSPSPPPPSPPSPSPPPPLPPPPPPPMCFCEQVLDNANLFDTCVKVVNGVRICQGNGQYGTCPSDHVPCPSVDDNWESPSQTGCVDRKKVKKCAIKKKRGKCATKRKVRKKCRYTCGIC